MTTHISMNRNVTSPSNEAVSTYRKNILRALCLYAGQNNPRPPDLVVQQPQQPPSKPWKPSLWLRPMLRCLRCYASNSSNRMAFLSTQRRLGARYYSALSLISACTSLLGGGLLLTSCSSSSKITGKRELFVPATQELSVDLSVAKKPFHLPPPQTTRSCTQERGSAAHTAVHDAFDATKARLLAQIPLGQRAARRDVLVSNMLANQGKLFGCTADGRLFAVDTASSKIVWTLPVPQLTEDVVKVGGLALTSTGDLVMAAANGDILLVDTTSGKMKKQRNLGCSLRSAPTVSGDHLFIQSVNNRLFALDTQLNTLWSLEETPENVVFLGNGSPAAANDLVLAAFSTGEYKAYDAHTGTEVWMSFMTPEFLDDTYGNILQIRASPVISDSLAFVLGHGGSLVATHALSGVRQWSVAFSGLDTPAVAGDWLFAVDEHGYVFCFEKATGRVRWSSALPDGGSRKRRPMRWTAPILANNSVLFFTEYGDFVVLDAATGKTQLVLPTKIEKPVHALIVDQKLFVLSQRGVLYVYGQ